MMAAVGTPVKVLSSRVQWVTQCKSHTTSTGGIARNSAYVRSYGASHAPNTRSRQLGAYGSTNGTLPACSTGHLAVSVCPGGVRALRSPRAVSGLMIFGRVSSLIFEHRRC